MTHSKLLAKYKLQIVPAHVYTYAASSGYDINPCTELFRLRPCKSGADLLHAVLLGAFVMYDANAKHDVLPALVTVCARRVENLKKPQIEQYLRNGRESCLEQYVIGHAMWLFRNYKPWAESAFYAAFCLYTGTRIARWEGNIFARELCKFSQHLESLS